MPFACQFCRKIYTHLGQLEQYKCHKCAAFFEQLASVGIQLPDILDSLQGGWEPNLEEWQEHSSQSFTPSPRTYIDYHPNRNKSVVVDPAIAEKWQAYHQ